MDLSNSPFDPKNSAISETDRIIADLSPEKQQAIIRQLLREGVKNAQESFYKFVLLIGPTIIPEGFQKGRHIELICEELQSLFESVVNPHIPTKRLQIFLPPRAMKSRLTSILFPCWVFGKKPSWSIISISNSVTFAQDEIGATVRDIINSPSFKSIFPETQLRPTQKAKGMFTTTKGGKYLATGAGAALAGRGCHILIADDVLSEQNAYSKAERNKINKWYISGARTRLSPKPQGAEIIVNTRWSLDDLSGYLLNVDKDGKRPWRVISVPAILDEEGSKLLKRPTDPEDKYTIGSSFWPEFQPLEALEERKREFSVEGDAHKWNALYMQNPIPPEGNIVSYKDWQYWDNEALPEIGSIMISMDTAFSTKEKADFSAYTVWGVFAKKERGYKGEEFYRNHAILLQAGRGKWDFSELCDKVIELNQSYKPDVFIIEKRSSGLSLIPEMEKRGIPIYAYTSDKDKEVRLHAVSPLFRTKTIWVPADEECRNWVDIVIDEVCNFPSVKHDDLTDTVSMALQYLRDHMAIVHPQDYVLQLDDEEDNYSGNRRTYWSVVSSGRGL